MKIRFENRMEDMKKAMAVVDARGPVSQRKVFWYLGCVMVLYWYIPPVFREPDKVLNWVMGLIGVLLTLYVWKGNELYNMSFAKRYVKACPEGEAIVGEKTIELTDAYGKTTIDYDGEYKAYDYENVLAFHGAKNKLAVLPLEGQSREVREALRDRLREKMGERYEFVNTLKTPWLRKKN